MIRKRSRKVTDISGYFSLQLLNPRFFITILGFRIAISRLLKRGLAMVELS